MFVQRKSSVWSSVLCTVLLPAVFGSWDRTPLLEALLLDKYGTPTYFLYHLGSVQIRCSCDFTCPIGALLQLVGPPGDGQVLAERVVGAELYSLHYNLVIDKRVLQNGSYSCRLVVNSGGQMALNYTSRSFYSWPRLCPDDGKKTWEADTDPSTCGDRFASFCTVGRDDQQRYCDHIRHQWCKQLRAVQPHHQRWTACMTALVDSSSHGPTVYVETAAPTTCHAFSIGRDVHFEVAEGYRCTSYNFLDVNMLDQSGQTPFHWRQLVLDMVQPFEQNDHRRLVLLVRWSSTSSEAVIDCDLVKPGGAIIDSFRLRGSSPQLANFTHDGPSSKLVKIACYLFPNKEAAAGRTVAMARAQGLVLLWDVRTEIWPPFVNCAALYVLRCRFVKAASKDFKMRVVWMLEQQVVAESTGSYVDMFVQKAGRYTCIGMQKYRSFNPPTSFSQSATSYVDIPAGCLDSAPSTKVLIPHSSSQLQQERELAASRLLSLLFADRLDNDEYIDSVLPDQHTFLKTLKTARRNHLMSMRYDFKPPLQG